MPAELELTLFTTIETGQLYKKVQVTKSKPFTICGKVVSRASDLARHMKIHCSDVTKKLPCPKEGCKFRTLQQSNLDTHYRTHSKNKSKICPSYKFQICDPSSLLRHRKRIHKYKTRSSNSSNTSNSSPISPNTPGLPLSSSNILSPNFFPFGESDTTSTSSSHFPMPHMDPSHHCQESHLFSGNPLNKIKRWVQNHNQC